MGLYVDEDSSHGLRILLLLYVMASLILCGGTVFGFQGLEAVLLDESVYEEQCEENEQVPCDAQMLRLDLMFTLASSFFSVYLFPAGILLQFIGPRNSFFLGLLLVLAGSALFIFANSETFDVYIPAFMLIGAGNPLLYISAFNFSKLYPKSSNVLLSIFIGCFGFSAIVFYVFEKVHVAYGWSSSRIFEAYSLAPIALIVLGVFLLPKDVYHIQRQKKLASLSNGNVNVDGEAPLLTDCGSKKALDVTLEADEKTPLLADKAEGEDIIADVPSSNGEEANEELKASTAVPLQDQTIRQEMQSPPFIAQTIFFSWGMLHLNFYLGTAYDQLLLFDYTGGEMADKIMEAFDLAYPLGCLASILPVGLLVRNTRVSTSILVYCVANLIFAALCLVPINEVQWITVHLFILVRVAFFTVMSTYSAYMFGFKHLSTMFGASGGVAGIVSLFSYGLSYIALGIDDDFTLVNTILLVGAILNFAFPIATRRFWESHKSDESKVQLTKV